MARKIQNLRARHFAPLMVVGLISACGTNDVEAPLPKNTNAQSQGNGDATAEHGIDAGMAVVPEQEYYQAVLERKFALISSTTEKVAASNQKGIFVNFQGAVVQKGYGRGQSFLVCDDEAMIPPSNLNAASKQEIMKGLKGVFDAAKININIVDVKPSSGEYSVLHVGGNAADLGCGNDDVALGKSAFDQGNSNASDVSFVFELDGATTHQTTIAIAHQIGHSMGLDDLEEVGSVMSRYYHESNQAFGKGTQVTNQKSVDQVRQLQENLAPAATKLKLMALAGTPSNSASTVLSQLPADLSNLTGLDVIASLGALLNDFKSDKPMDITPVLNQIDATLPGGMLNAQNIGGIQGIEDLLSVIILAAEAAAKQNGGTVQSNGVEALLKIFLDPSKLKANDLLSIAGLAAQIGIAAATGGASAAIVAAINMIIGGISSATPPPANTPSLTLASNPNLPKFDQLLGVNGATNFQGLIATLEAHATIVNSNFRGNARQALLTMLKLAYSQAFQKLGEQGVN
jgi:hypothetical protein